MEFRQKKTISKNETALNKLVRVKGLEPPWITPLDPKSSASTNSAIPAKLNGGPYRTRTYDRPVMSRML